MAFGSRILEIRLKKCRACPYVIPEGRVTPMRCSLCGCIMKLKARLPGASCPGKRWPI